MRNVRELGLSLQDKGDESFCVPHVLLIPLAQLHLEDMLFHPDTVTETNQRTSHDDEQTQPVRQAEPKSEQYKKEACIRGMPNEAVGTRFDHGLLGCDCNRRREEDTKHGNGVEPQCDPRIHQENAQPEEDVGCIGDGGGRNLKSQPYAEEETEHDQAKEDHMRSFILTLGTSTETFERPDIHARFHHFPDEKTSHQDTQQQTIMNEKRLHIPHPFPWNPVQSSVSSSKKGK